MAHFGSHEAWVRYQQAEGFRVGKVSCLGCHFKWHASIFPETNDARLECPACHVQQSQFEELEVKKS